MTSQGYTEDRKPSAKKVRAAGPPLRIGFLGGATPQAWAEFFKNFKDELNLLGWMEGSDFTITPRWGEGKRANYAAAARNLAQSNDMIVTAGTEPLKAAIDATSTIPIIVASAGFTRALPSNVTGFLNGQ